jgi:hypothetical protein
MTKAPTKTETSDADLAVNSPAEFKRLWDERMRLVKQRAEKLGELDAEIEQFDREHGQEPTPPGPQAAADLSEIWKRIAEAWPEHVAYMERSIGTRIKTPFGEESLMPTLEVLDAILITGKEIEDVIAGERSPDRLIRAAAAILDFPEEGDRRTQVRQALALDRCEAVLRAWRKAQSDYRRKRISTEDHRDEEKFIPRHLIFALSEIEPGFSKLKRVYVKTLLKKARSKASPVTLLLALMKPTGVWPDTGESALRNVFSQKRQIDT